MVVVGYSLAATTRSGTREYSLFSSMRRVVFGERHLRHLLLSYVNYYNEARTHLSLNKDAPISRAVATTGRIIGRPVLGGLHHRYVRI